MAAVFILPLASFEFPTASFIIYFPILTDLMLLMNCNNLELHV
jgi:hypothetical protein